MAGKLIGKIKPIYVEMTDSFSIPLEPTVKKSLGDVIVCRKLQLVYPMYLVLHTGIIVFRGGRRAGGCEMHNLNPKMMEHDASMIVFFETVLTGSRLSYCL